VAWLTKLDDERILFGSVNAFFSFLTGGESGIDMADDCRLILLRLDVAGEESLET
jgi:hypothetical protein